MDREPCKARVWHSGAFRSTSCQNAATRDGFCGTHHPDAVARREAARSDRRAAEFVEYQEKRRAADAARRRLEAFDDLVAALRNATAFVEAWTGNGVQEQPEGRLIDATTGAFDAETIAREARAALAKAGE